MTARLLNWTAMSSQEPGERGHEAESERDRHFEATELERTVASSFSAVVIDRRPAVLQLRRHATLGMDHLGAEHRSRQHDATGQSDERGFQVSHDLRRNASPSPQYPRERDAVAQREHKRHFHAAELHAGTTHCAYHLRMAALYLRGDGSLGVDHLDLEHDSRQHGANGHPGERGFQVSHGLRDKLPLASQRHREHDHETHREWHQQCRATELDIAVASRAARLHHSLQAVAQLRSIGGDHLHRYEQSGHRNACGKCEERSFQVAHEGVSERRHSQAGKAGTSSHEPHEHGREPKREQGFAPAALHGVVADRLQAADFAADGR